MKKSQRCKKWSNSIERIPSASLIPGGGGSRTLALLMSSSRLSSLYQPRALSSSPLPFFILIPSTSLYPFYLSSILSSPRLCLLGLFVSVLFPFDSLSLPSTWTATLTVYVASRACSINHIFPVLLQNECWARLYSREEEGQPSVCFWCSVLHLTYADLDTATLRAARRKM